MDNFPLLDRFNNWLKESVMVKLFSIGVLMLILMIPSFWVQDLIRERQVRGEEVIAEVAEKWAANQTLTGPVLKIPFRDFVTEKEWTGDVERTRVVETKRYAYFLADNLTIDGTVSPEVLQRGIFDVSVYDSKIKINATFGDIDFAKLNVSADQIFWSEASLVLGITDLQGIHENPKVRSGSTSFTSESSGDIGLTMGQHSSASNYDINRTVVTTGIVVPFDWKSKDDIVKEFSIELDLKGSERLYFVPAGKTTTVSLSGAWSSPSFDGKMLPTTRNTSGTDFNATWKVLSFNRPIADQWIDTNEALRGTEFGVRLLIPADQYQKSMRTAKYDALIILLAFTSLFLVEITRKVRIHPFQYILVGVALSVYYTLLLSISEYLGYNAAYAIASVATIVLLSLYSTTFFKQRSLVLLFSAVMSIFYVFIFVIIQAEDFSLLIGSVGLFMIIAVVMYFSRNIRWYKEEAITE
ncbi:MAG TPA: cell envelope integrity protein CreD [Cyclobacteriaceae bacterium]|nr:cell envelope integrity protein CreD [Cyclobacteriaceae bacterium]